MKAIILAGGYGTRLYPLTINAPKPMIQIGGKPMVEYLVEKIQKIDDITHTYIVSNDKFTHVFDEWLKEKKYPNITIVNDGTTSNEDRLGSVGDIQFVLDHYLINEDVIILGGDNFFEDNLRGLVKAFHEKGNIIALHNEDNLEIVKRFGYPTLDDAGKVVSFIEKPENPTTTMHSTLIYLIKNGSLGHVKTVIESGKADLAGDLIAYLCQKEDVYGVALEGKWFDIGTMDTLKKVEDWVTLETR